MYTISIIVKKGGEKESFSEPKSVSLMTIIEKINEQNLSLEEAEEKAGVKNGDISRIPYQKVM